MDAAEIYQASIGYFLRPIQHLLKEPEITEIMINGFRDIRVERKGRITQTELTFASEAALLAAARNIAEFNGRALDEMNLAMDGRLPDGSRVHIITPPTARNGIHVTIRRFQKATFDLPSLVNKQSITETAAEFLDVAVKLHKNIVISGGTGSGKTSMLNALSSCIPTHERVVVIEDTSELQLSDRGHTVCLEAQQGNGEDTPQVSIRELFANTLRMRPDRIIVGEVRRGEALDLIQSMISGHAGALTTVHASTPRDAVIRLETLCLMNDAELPVYVARQQVASAVHLVVQLSRMADGSRRVQSIAECCGMNEATERGHYVWNDLFEFRAAGRDQHGRILGELHPTGNKPTFSAEPIRQGLSDCVILTTSLFSNPDQAA